VTYKYLSPEERAADERAENLRLAEIYGTGTPVRVCFHVDRTVIKVPEKGWLIECDYCPGRAVVLSGDVWPDIEPNYYTDPL
jgi:hypothetical protein